MSLKSQLRDYEFHINVQIDLIHPSLKTAVINGLVLGSVYQDGEVWANLESFNQWLLNQDANPGS